jgi:alkylhydroperoxidase family enzyme
VPNEKFLALADYATSELFDARERTAIEYAERITITNQDVTDELFDRLRQVFSEDEIVELTATIAWENCSSKFNRALRVDSQQLWKCKEADYPS